MMNIRELTVGTIFDKAIIEFLKCNPITQYLFVSHLTREMGIPMWVNVIGLGVGIYFVTQPKSPGKKPEVVERPPSPPKMIKDKVEEEIVKKSWFSW